MNAAQWFQAGREAGLAKPLFHWAAKPPFVVGMGGSGIAGAILAARQNGRLLRPRGGFPANTGIPGQLVLVSWSGDTVETLAWLARIGHWGSKTNWRASHSETEVRIVTRGGRLGREAKKRGIPMIKVAHPGPPRRALYELMGILDGLLPRAGKTPTWDGVGPAAREVAKAEEIARDWARQGLLPWIFAGQGDEALLRRWTGQLQEDAKVPAGGGLLPEAAHNQLEALGGSPLPVGVVILPGPPEGLAERVAAVLAKRGVPTYLPATKGTVPLCLLADAFALAWAKERGVEPDPIPTITALKSG
ncbi:hypothetical protein IIA16_01650 [bacterium]|nr:hypothetical protein [bacterium]